MKGAGVVGDAPGQSTEVTLTATLDSHEVVRSCGAPDITVMAGTDTAGVHEAAHWGVHDGSGHGFGACRPSAYTNVRPGW